MSRREMIVIAVLVNAGLLIALFSSALKSESSAPPVRENKRIAAAVAPPEPEKVVVSPPPQKNLTTAKAIVSSFVDEKPQSVFHEEVPVVKEMPIIPTPSVKNGNYVEIQVKKGDMLEKIARDYNTTVDELIEINHLSTTRLNVGQVLRVPMQKKVSTPAADEHKYYIVKQGDNPWTIAVKNHIKLEELLQLNNLNEEKARRLKPGDKLRIK
jgi:peptidoglycan DL-endopeptidase LytF